jgi:hypothetical protein
LVTLREELLRGDLRSLYLGWLAGAGELRDDTLEPEVPAGLSELTLPQQALAEFLEIDRDILVAASAGSARAPRTGAEEEGRLDAWLGEWSRDQMVAVLKLMAQGRGQEAERRVRSRHAAWLKVKRAPTVPAAPRRSVAELRELAESAFGARLEREAKERAEKEAERSRLREAQLRRLMADADKHWEAADAQAQRGSASGYDQAVRALADLAEGYALTSSPKEFERALRRFLVRHAKRGALMRRLTEAGLWSG